MDLYTKPELISDEVLRNLQQDIKTVRQKESYHSLGGFAVCVYEDIVSPNMFAICILLLFFLIIYLNRLLKEKIGKKSAKKYSDLIDRLNGKVINGLI